MAMSDLKTVLIIEKVGIVFAALRKKANEMSCLGQQRRLSRLR